MAESIREITVQYPSGNVTMKAFVAAPQTKEKRPAVIVIQEWWGLTDHIKDIARRYAAEGYVAIAPDLNSRLGHALTTDAGEAGKLMNTLKCGSAPGLAAPEPRTQRSSSIRRARPRDSKGFARSVPAHPRGCSLITGTGAQQHP